jgi:hypothetical protein
MNKCFLATSGKKITTFNKVVAAIVYYDSEEDGDGFENTSEGTWLNPGTCTLLFGNWSHPCRWIPSHKATIYGHNCGN